MSVLLNPGPVNLSERVRAALTRPDICHREPEFSRLQTGIRDKLLDVYALPAEDWAAVLLTASGTAAMEAMLCSLCGRNDRLLIIENGVYGERLRRIAGIHGIPAETLRLAWDRPLNAAQLEARLSAGITRIALVQHETATGRLNDVAAVGRVAKNHGIPLLVDGVSSFGAEELRFEDWNIAACAGTANKCLHGVPGTAFVVVNRGQMPDGDGMVRSLYLDLGNYLHQQDRGSTPFTQSAQILYALDVALDEHREEGGWMERRALYRRRMARTRSRLMDLGVRPLLHASECSCVLHAYHLPEGIAYSEFHDRLKDAGFVIYAGQGELANRVFRISMMGAITMADVERFIDAVEKIVK